MRTDLIANVLCILAGVGVILATVRTYGTRPGLSVIFIFLLVVGVLLILVGFNVIPLLGLIQ